MWSLPVRVASLYPLVAGVGLVGLVPILFLSIVLTWTGLASTRLRLTRLPLIRLMGPGVTPIRWKGLSWDRFWRTLLIVLVPARVDEFWLSRLCRIALPVVSLTHACALGFVRGRVVELSIFGIGPRLLVARSLLLVTGTPILVAGTLFLVGRALLRVLALVIVLRRLVGGEKLAGFGVSGLAGCLVALFLPELLRVAVVTSLVGITSGVVVLARVV